MPRDGGEDDRNTAAAQARAKAHQEVEEGRKQAFETWETAKKALDRVVKDSHGRARSPVPSRRSMQCVWSGRTSPTTADSGVTAGRLTTADTGVSRKDFAGILTEGSEEEDRTHLPRKERVAAARAGAHKVRSRLMMKRALNTKEKLAEHSKRKLRVKIMEVIQEVRRRQALDQHQMRLRKFQEIREKQGRGPAVGTGDADAYALGLVGQKGKIEDDQVVEQGASPRRSRLLEALSLEELDMLRRDPWFYFDNNVLEESGAVSAAPKPSMQQAVQSLEPLIDFFAVTREDKHLDPAVYAQRLRNQLVAEAVTASGVEHREPTPQKASTTSVSWSEGPLEPLERMPCLGRRPAVRNDEESPTLWKVREVYERRDVLDAKWLEDKKEAMTRKTNVNEFKAQEQQRELEMASLQQRELHKLRLIGAQERKAIAEAEMQERAEILEWKSQQKLLQAAAKSEDVLEDRRSKASTALDHWYSGVTRSERFLRDEERQRIARAEAKWNGYTEKLWKVGEKRKVALDSQAQKNDTLRSKIQSSLVDQLAEQQQMHRDTLAEELEAKMQAAEERRRNGLRGTRYNFVEKAFGREATDFDAKHHSVATDRRSPSWRSSADEWSRQSIPLGGGGSRSEPSLSLTNGLSGSLRY